MLGAGRYPAPRTGHVLRAGRVSLRPVADPFQGQLAAARPVAGGGAGARAAGLRNRSPGVPRADPDRAVLRHDHARAHPARLPDRQQLERRDRRIQRPQEHPRAAGVERFYRPLLHLGRGPGRLRARHRVAAPRAGGRALAGGRAERAAGSFLRLPGAEREGGGVRVERRAGRDRRARSRAHRNLVTPHLPLHPSAVWCLGHAVGGRARSTARSSAPS